MFNVKDLRTTMEDALNMVKYIANQNRIIDTSHHTFKAVFYTVGKSSLHPKFLRF